MGAELWFCVWWLRGAKHNTKNLISENTFQKVPFRQETFRRYKFGERHQHFNNAKLFKNTCVLCS